MEFSLRTIKMCRFEIIDGVKYVYCIKHAYKFLLREQVGFATVLWRLRQCVSCNLGYCFIKNYHGCGVDHVNNSSEVFITNYHKFGVICNFCCVCTNYHNCNVVNIVNYSTVVFFFMSVKVGRVFFCCVSSQLWCWVF